MNKQEYILDLIKKGYTNEDIEILVNTKFPEELVVTPASPTDKITPQQALDRTIAAVKKVNENNPIIKISNELNTSAIYDLLEINKWYSIGDKVVFCGFKDATYAVLRGLEATAGEVYIVGFTVRKDATGTGLPIKALDNLFVADPSDAKHAATKKYVDDKVASAGSSSAVWTTISKPNASHKDKLIRVTFDTNSGKGDIYSITGYLSVAKYNQNDFDRYSIGGFCEVVSGSSAYGMNVYFQPDNSLTQGLGFSITDGNVKRQLLRVIKFEVKE